MKTEAATQPTLFDLGAYPVADPATPADPPVVQMITVSAHVRRKAPPRPFSGIALARSTDPDTSHEAAKSMEGAPANETEARVLDQIVLAGIHGATADEIIERSGLAQNTVTPRFAPLRRKGYIIDSGMRRPGNSGRAMIVWKATKGGEPR